MLKAELLPVHDFSLTVRKEAELDISTAFKYYEAQRLGLGHDFLLCVEESMSKIEKTPKSYKVIHKELRRVAIKRFPYRIFYLIQERCVIVTAVFHVRKNPQIWDDRIL